MFLEAHIKETRKLWKAIPNSVKRILDWKSRDAELCPHSESPCPAKGKLCYACEKMKHFASICRSKCKSVNQVEEKQSCSENRESDEEYLTGIETSTLCIKTNPKLPEK